MNVREMSGLEAATVLDSVTGCAVHTLLAHATATCAILRPQSG